VIVKIIFYSARGMNRGVSIFSEGIILDDYCCIWNVLTLSVQMYVAKMYYVVQIVLPLSACFLNMCFVLTCAFYLRIKS
jgi:hypothetical protein